MDIDRFFELFLEELKQNDTLTKYYKFHSSKDRFIFRKAYFIQRLQYVVDNLPKDKRANILDLGCGYGTTAIFLVLNGYKIEGLTLEFYFKIIQQRLKFWEQYGDVSGFSYRYADLFDGLPKNSYDTIIIQDTLHHLEPIDKALTIISNSLRKNGYVIAVEENGSNIIQNLKLIKQRGFKKVKTIYDETLQKEILIGDENIRSLTRWENLLKPSGLEIDFSTVNYIRYYLPKKCKHIGLEKTIVEEQSISSNFLKEYFFFGINFIAKK